MCSLASISNAAVPICISPHASPPLALWAKLTLGLLLTTQHAVKKVNAVNRRRGPMMMRGFLVGIKVSNANAPTKVMLMPASMMQRPHAQQRAGEGRFWGRRQPCVGGFLSAEHLDLDKAMMTRVIWNIQDR